MGRETNKQRRERQAASAREKAAAARAAQQRSEQRRRATLVLSSVVVLAVVVGLIVVLAVTTGGKASSGGSGRATASPQVVSTVTSVSPAALQSVGKGGATLSAQPTNGDPALTANGKPEMLYVGGEFCPYCAAERWSMIVALSRFGKFSGLSYMRSGANDGDIATFTFYKATYTSKYLDFTPVEVADRDGKSLEKLTSVQQSVFSKYTNGYPFIDFGGKYYQKGAGYPYTDLSGKTQSEIAQALTDPSSKIAQDILGEANNLTAAICAATANQPAKVCQSSTITSLESQLHA